MSARGVWSLTGHKEYWPRYKKLLKRLVLGIQENANVNNLQKIVQNLDVNFTERQSVIIKDSDAYTVTQTEIQLDAVVQAAINILAQPALNNKKGHR
jgi:hypothetical protein